MCIHELYTELCPTKAEQIGMTILFLATRSIQFQIAKHICFHQASEEHLNSAVSRVT